VKIYIAGPMTGLPEFNFPAFAAAEAKLRALGHEPVNPAKLHGDAPLGSKTHEEYMRVALRTLLDCEGIYLLHGWSGSQAAWLENQVAHASGLRVFSVWAMAELEGEKS